MMYFELFILDNYNEFVWPALILTFSLWLYLYLKTFRELKKLEDLISNQVEENNPKVIKCHKQKRFQEKAMSNSLI